MVIKATVFSIFVYAISSFLYWLFPNLIDGLYGFIFSLLISPFVAGYVVYLQDGAISQKSERWLYAGVFSLLLTLFVAGFVVYYLTTPEGLALIAEKNVQPGFITNLVYAFCFFIIFLMYLFANRIGFGLGLKFGEFADTTKHKAISHMNS